MIIQNLDNIYCQTALKYIKLPQFKTIPALKDSLRNIAISIKDKKAIVQKTTFPPLLKSTLKEPRIPVDIARLAITEKQIYNALIVQSTQKATSPDKINFEILHMIQN